MERLLRYQEENVHIDLIAMADGTEDKPRQELAKAQEHLRDVESSPFREIFTERGKARVSRYSTNLPYSLECQVAASALKEIANMYGRHIGMQHLKEIFAENVLKSLSILLFEPLHRPFDPLFEIDFWFPAKFSQCGGIHCVAPVMSGTIRNK